MARGRRGNGPRSQEYGPRSQEYGRGGRASWLLLELDQVDALW
jgi:hypothetical protein